MLQFFLHNWHLILGIILGIYEVVVRVIPTVGNISILNIIIQLLDWLNTHLNVTKK
jgi:hypothetical protein